MEIVFATRTALASHPRHGGVVEVIEGTHYLAADPIVAAYPDLFSADVRSGLRSSDPFEADGLPAWAERPEVPEEAEPEQEPEQAERTKTPPVETADATPGTKRTRTPAKKTAAKKAAAAKGDTK